MPKLLWVLLPLAAVAAWLALQAARGAVPSRPTLNVLFSLLLLGYVGGTAGLGLFWVANQQLPAFDWHYLFGYATVLVLLIHLGFNLRVVWQHLRHRPDTGLRAAARVPAPPSAGGRRPLLGAAGVAGVAAAAGLGYFVGLRHGRTELHLGDAGIIDTASTRPAPTAAPSPAPGAATAAAAAAQAWAVVERFHAFSAHSRTRVLRHAASTDWGAAPPPFKRYAAAARMPLPDPTPRARRSLAVAATAADIAALASCLWHTAGVSERRGGIAFRTAPSSGALFASEWYVLALDMRGVAAGLWHYDAEGHALERLPGSAGAEARARRGEAGAVLATFGPLALPGRCHALVVASAVFARSGHKYGHRTYRYVLADLGHALENLRRAAGAGGGIKAIAMAHFDDAAIAAALGLDASREAVLAVVALAPVGLEAVAPAPGTRDGQHWIPALRLGPNAPARLGLTEAMQAATSLQAVAAAAAQAPASPAAAPAPTVAAAAAAAPAALAAHPLPAARPLAADVLPVIARRRSLRRFSEQPLSPQLLADVLGAMTAPAAVLSPAVRIDVLTAAVEGIESASWRVDTAVAPVAPARLLRRVPHGAALRARARAAALDQDVIGDAAVVFVLSLDRARLQADPAGAARGYRHGFIEAGLVGERIYLAAGMLGLAACAVGAFYDDEAAALVGLDSASEWPVHFAALGWAA